MFAHGRAGASHSRSVWLALGRRTDGAFVGIRETEMIGLACFRPETHPSQPKLRVIETIRFCSGGDASRSRHPSRVKVDRDADDIEAEVRRLEALGAVRVAHATFVGHAHTNRSALLCHTGQRSASPTSRRSGAEP